MQSLFPSHLNIPMERHQPILDQQKAKRPRRAGCIKRRNPLLNTPEKTQRPSATHRLLACVTPMANNQVFENPMQHVGVTSNDFIGFNNIFNGYCCRFLKQEAQMLLKFQANKAVFTKFDSLAIFEMADYLRQLYYAKMEQLMSVWQADFVSFENPFAYQTGEDGKPKPIFIRLSTTCSFYKKLHDEIICCHNKKDMTPPGKCFTCRLAVTVKGVRFSPDGLTLKPILMVSQILDLPSPTLLVPKSFDRCILDDDSALDIPTSSDVAEETLDDSFNENVEELFQSL